MKNNVPIGSINGRIVENKKTSVKIPIENDCWYPRSKNMLIFILDPYFEGRFLNQFKIHCQ